MKRKFLIILLVIALLLLSACGSATVKPKDPDVPDLIQTPTPSAGTAPETAPSAEPTAEPTAEPSATPSAEPTATPEPSGSPAPASPDIDSQLKLIADSCEEWWFDPEEDCTYYYTVTDLDGNGRLEIVVSAFYPEDYDTMSYFWEVSEDGSELELCDYPYGDEYSEPDIVEDGLNWARIDGVTYYFADDFLTEEGSCASYRQVLSIEDGTVWVEELFYWIADYVLEDDVLQVVEVSYYDDNYEPVSEAAFVTLSDSYMTDWDETGVCSLSWEVLGPEDNYYAVLKSLWEGFSMTDGTVGDETYLMPWQLFEEYTVVESSEDLTPFLGDWVLTEAESEDGTVLTAENGEVSGTLSIREDHQLSIAVTGLPVREALELSYSWIEDCDGEGPESNDGVGGFLYVEAGQGFLAVMATEENELHVQWYEWDQETEDYVVFFLTFVAEN